MRRVRFLLTAYVDGRYCEAGSEHLIGDDVPLHAHMVDVDTDTVGQLPMPFGHTPVFLDHSGDTRLDGDATSQSGGYVPALAERAKDGAG